MLSYRHPNKNVVLPALPEGLGWYFPEPFQGRVEAEIHVMKTNTEIAVGVGETLNEAMAACLVMLEEPA